jgi:hypothetical protein
MLDSPMALKIELSEETIEKDVKPCGKGGISSLAKSIAPE